MLKIYNNTDRVLYIHNVMLKENSSIMLNIPYSENLKTMEKRNVISVEVMEDPVMDIAPVKLDEPVVEQSNIKPPVSVTEIKRGRKPKSK